MKKIKITPKTTADQFDRILDKWTAQKEQLAVMANQLADADARVVEAHRALIAAQKTFQTATETRTRCEKRFNVARSKLGAE